MHVDERQQDVKAGLQTSVEPAEPLDDERALLRDDDGRLRKMMTKDEERQRR